VNLVVYKITEGSDYYGPDKMLFSLSHWNQEQDGYNVNIVFAPGDNKKVYSVEVCDYKNNRAYRRAIPEHEGDNQAWDGVEFVDLESDDDFIEKALAIMNGEEYDTRVSIPIELPESELLALMTMAHERDMTFNDFIGSIVAHYAEKILGEGCAR
jgi:hypothetical protein